MTSFCYILECSDGSYYTGWSNDPDRRLKAHNAGKGARYTRSRRPVRLVYIEELPDRASAMRRERQIKALGRDQKKKLIQWRSPLMRKQGEQGCNGSAQG
jgi:putative endonuclease